MRERLVAGLFVVVCFLVSTPSGTAQVSEMPFEVGGLVTVIDLNDFHARVFPPSRGDSVVAGIGGRFAYNMNDYFAIDGEVSFFPKNQIDNVEFGQKIQGLIGLKAGVRKKWGGVFAKARPGVLWFGDLPSRGNCNITSFGSVCDVSHEKSFAMDVGGVIEFYPTKRLIVRGDVGDTIIHYSRRVLGIQSVPVTINAETKHNLQLTFGIGWRF